MIGTCLATRVISALDCYTTQNPCHTIRHPTPTPPLLPIHLIQSIFKLSRLNLTSRVSQSDSRQNIVEPCLVSGFKQTLITIQDETFHLIFQLIKKGNFLLHFFYLSTSMFADESTSIGGFDSIVFRLGRPLT